jgi:hypothetical protein
VTHRHNFKGTPSRNDVDKPLPVDPSGSTNPKADDDAGGATSTASSRPHAWQRMRDEHERAVQQGAAATL